MPELTDDQLDQLIRNIGLRAPRKQAACGTRSGYERHRSKGEPTCEACRKANAQRKREENAAPVKAPGQLRPIEHGTLKGYKQHWYRKEPACEPCREANRLDCLARSKQRNAKAGSR